MNVSDEYEDDPEEMATDTMPSLPGTSAYEPRPRSAT